MMHRRSFHGFAQFREGNRGPWRFHCSTFGGNGSDIDDRANVLTDDDKTKPVYISPTGYLHIAGRKYGPKHWDH